MLDRSALVGKASSPAHGEQPNSQIIDVETTTPTESDLDILTQSKSGSTPSDRKQSKLKVSIVTEAKTIPPEVEKFNFESELDALSIGLKPANEPTAEPEWSSIATTLETIAAAQPLSNSQQLLQELHDTREQIAAAHAQLEFLDKTHRERIETIDSSLLEVKQLKFRTQQLARHSKNQTEKVREMLVSIEQIRAEISGGLDKFGGHHEIRSMLSELNKTRHALILAHDRLKTGQEAFYESLQAIQVQVAAHSHDSEAKLIEYQQSILALTQEISAERLKIATISADMSVKFTELQGLGHEITTMHGQIVDKSQTMQSTVTRCERQFDELAQSVQKEKQQFYELTAEMINKVEGMRGQFGDIAKHNGLDRQVIADLQTEIESIRRTINYETAQQLDRLDRHYDETIATWSELQVRQKASTREAKNFYNWLWLLSFAVGLMFVLLITVLLMIPH